MPLPRRALEAVLASSGFAGESAALVIDELEEAVSPKPAEAPPVPVVDERSRKRKAKPRRRRTRPRCQRRRQRTTPNGRHRAGGGRRHRPARFQKPTCSRGCANCAWATGCTCRMRPGAWSRPRCPGSVPISLAPAAGQPPRRARADRIHRGTGRDGETRQRPGLATPEAALPVPGRPAGSLRGMDAPIRLLIHGANGRMGRALQRLCREGEGGEVVAAVSRKVESRVIDGVPQFAASELAGVPEFDAAIDFSLPEGFDAILGCAAARQAAGVRHDRPFMQQQAASMPPPRALRWPGPATSASASRSCTTWSGTRRAPLPGWDCDIVEASTTRAQARRALGHRAHAGPGRGARAERRRATPRSAPATSSANTSSSSPAWASASNSRIARATATSSRGALHAGACAVWRAPGATACATCFDPPQPPVLGSLRRVRDRSKGFAPADPAQCQLPKPPSARMPKQAATSSRPTASRLRNPNAMPCAVRVLPLVHVPDRQHQRRDPRQQAGERKHGTRCAVGEQRADDRGRIPDTGRHRPASARTGRSRASANRADRVAVGWRTGSVRSWQGIPPRDRGAVRLRPCAATLPGAPRGRRDRTG